MNYTPCTFCNQPAVAACACGKATCNGCSYLPKWQKHDCPHKQKA